MARRPSKKPKNALEAIRKAPMRAAWEPHMARVFNAPSDLIPPQSIQITKAARSQIATYKAHFTGTSGPDADISVRLRILPEGGGEIVGRDIRMAWKVAKPGTVKAKAKAPAWIHTTDQLIADLREACGQYYFRNLVLEARVKAMEAGIAQAMTSLSSDPDHDVVWFSKHITLWEHLSEVRDPEEVKPLPPNFVPDERLAQAYASLPRDPATGRPVIL